MSLEKLDKGFVETCLQGWRPCNHVAVAWSGGADSTALLLALHVAGYRPQAWHIDHAWRHRSGEEASLLAEWAKEWGIPFRSARCEAPRRNREALSRSQRYRILIQWARESKAPGVCLAHHLDDQAETVCLRLLQGAGPRGLQGMRKLRCIDGVCFYRPLLHMRRNVLREALRRAGIGWLEDPSNRDETLWRNRIRHRLFPAIRQAGYDPVMLFSRLGKAAARWQEKLEREIASLPIQSTSRGVATDWHKWQALPLSARASALQWMYETAFGAGKSLGRRHLSEVERWRRKGGNGGIDLTQCRLERVGERLQMIRRHGRWDFMDDSSSSL